MDVFLRLVLEHPGEEELVDPITRRAYDVPLQAMERRASEALDSMAWKQSLFFSAVDRIEAYDAEAKARGLNSTEEVPAEAREAREELLSFDRPEMVRRASELFDDSQVAKQLAEDFEASYDAMRLNRKSRLERALELAADGSISGWIPSTELLGAVQAEIRDMEFGVRPSDWYRVQHLFAEESGLLLFSPHQIDISGKHVGEDRWHNGPIKGTVDEIVGMLSVYVDGAAALKRGLDEAYSIPTHVC